MDFIVGEHHVNSEGPRKEPYRQDSDYLDKTPYNVALNNLAAMSRKERINQKFSDSESFCSGGNGAEQLSARTL